MFIKKTEVPEKESSLPGRADPMSVPETHFVNGHPLKPPFPEGMEMAMFALGCFWGAEKTFWETDGVYTTAVGYAGGYTPNATYQEVCSGMTGHTEVVLVVFDPQVVSYEKLLKIFWEAHDPTQGMRQGGDVGTQYRSEIYTYNDEQKKAALASREAYEEVLGASGLRSHHHRDRRCPRALLRRGLPSAVPGQEPERLLWPWRYRGRLSYRAFSRSIRVPADSTAETPRAVFSRPC